MCTYVKSSTGRVRGNKKLNLQKEKEKFDMKDKTKGLLRLLSCAIVIAVVGFITVVGIGGDKTGSMSDVKLGLDLAGGVSITYQAVKENPTQEEMDDTIYRMQQRASQESKESAVYQEGDNRINVDIPSVTDATAVLERLGNAGTIYFIYGKSPDGKQNIIYSAEKQNYILYRELDEIIADGGVVLDGADIVGAEPKIYNTENNLGVQCIVQLNLNDTGREKFANATQYAYSHRTSSSRTNYENLIAIVYDGEIISAPGVINVISDGVATISGQSTFEEAKRLASTIRIGALPLELTELRSNIVGAKLGAEAVKTSLIAGLIGFIIVFLFMIVYYRIPGLSASIALTLYVGLVIIALNIFDVTLTLPGIAGIILSVGMAVDANVIIFTRIKEELATGKTVRSGIKIGFHKALSAIVDGNVTTLIAAAVLYLFGSGTIKGFAQTLAIGIVLSMFTALVVTKYLLVSLYMVGCDKEGMYGVQKEPKQIDYIKNGKKFAVISVAIIAIGIIMMIVNMTKDGDALAYGLDFKGGSSTQVTFEKEMGDSFNQELENYVNQKIGAIPEIVKVQDENSYIIKTRVLTLNEKDELQNGFVNDYGVDAQKITTQNISATVSGEMKEEAVKAVIIATIGMLLYIWIRFKNLGFAGSAVIALIHDVLVVLMVYAVTKISVGNTFIACMLTLVGYSINATIVIFDRIRENIGQKLKKDSIKDIVNLSINQTFSRSINTSLTTLIMILFLAILGVDSVKEFAIPLLAGIICGAYSSICITGNLWYFFNKKKTSEE